MSPPPDSNPSLGSTRPEVSSDCLAEVSESVENYLERIDDLIREKGYARVSDLAETMGLSQPSVSVMIKRLAERGLLEREPYRGFRLTERGEAISVAMRRRHQTLTEFLTLLRVPSEVRERDVEGMEHHLSAETLAHIERLVAHWKKHPQAMEGILGAVD
ncbi:MAG TPA: iron dependent repressor, metal binding and dimerization domain protein [Candidatus Limnocylindria bacterium]|nr:iron dependent repressor, metal binding and dimerization domain protein [Candidatus Limnocylindria bacterium]